MAGGATDMGGRDGAFPRTTWGMISRLDPRSVDHRAGLEQLCSRYWRPIYTYVRVAWAKSNEDAKDLAQAFLLWIVEENPLKHYERERGSFRGYLKVLLRRFVGHQERALQRLKRGGGLRVTPIDDGSFLAEAVPDPKATDPEQSFDKAWRAGLLHRAIEKTRKRFDGEGRSRAFKIYEAYEFSAKEERPTYEDLARTHGLTANQIEGSLDAVREAIGGAVRAELAETTADDRELREEWNALFGS